MNRQRLRGEIIAKYGNQDNFADAIGWSKQKVSYILTGKRKLNTDDVAKVAQVLGLSESMFVNIFLPQALPNGNEAAV